MFKGGTQGVKNMRLTPSHPIINTVGLFDKKILHFIFNAYFGRMLKAPPVNPLVYIYWYYNIDPTEGS